MERMYLPQHWLMPFFDKKEIVDKTGDNSERRGWLDLTVIGDGNAARGKPYPSC